MSADDLDTLARIAAIGGERAARGIVCSAPRPADDADPMPVTIPTPRAHAPLVLGWLHGADAPPAIRYYLVAANAGDAPDAYGRERYAETIRALAERCEALTAERDAAVADLESERGFAEGRRQQRNEAAEMLTRRIEADGEPLAWGNVAWDSQRPDVLTLTLNAADGSERRAFIPREKVPLFKLAAEVAGWKPTRKKARK